jgi:hypothetical protein
VWFLSPRESLFRHRASKLFILTSVLLQQVAIDESAPDSSSLIRFRDCLSEERFVQISNQIVGFAREKGLISIASPSCIASM